MARSEEMWRGMEGRLLGEGRRKGGRCTVVRDGKGGRGEGKSNVIIS